MPICPVDEKGFCSRHQTVHVGRLLEISQMDNDFGESHRLQWDERMKTQPPTPVQMATNFGKAFVRHLKNGLVPVSNEEYDRRLAICEQCDYCDKTDDHWRCLHVDCGCRLKESRILPGKARWGSESCPMGRWPLPTVAPPATAKCGCDG